MGDVGARNSGEVVVGEPGLRFQVVPPSVVVTTAPPVPMAQPSFALKCTPYRSLPVFEVCCVQLAPPSVVAMIVPPGPTAQPWSGSTICTAEEVVAPVGSLPASHVVPPLVV